MTDTADQDPPEVRDGFVRRARLAPLRRSHIAGLAATALVLLAQISYGDGLEPPWRRGWFDLMQQVSPRERPVPPPAVVVAIEGQSLAAYGQWPWPRDLVAELLYKIVRLGPAAVALDIFFPEPDRLSPTSLAERLSRRDPQLGARVAELPDTDALLARIVRLGQIVLPVAGQEQRVGPNPPAPPAPPVVLDGGAPPPTLLSFPDAERSIDVIESAAAGHGAISADLGPDGVIRRVPALQTIEGELFPGLALEALRVAEGAFLTKVEGGPDGLVALNIGDVRIPVERDGSFWLRFGRLDTSRYIPASAVLDGAHVTRDDIAGKIVIVAVTGVGAVDEKTTALGETVIGVEAHLQFLEQIRQRLWLSRPHWLYYAETAALALFCIAVVWLVPALPPSLSIPGALGVAGGLAALAWGGFHGGLLVDGASPVLGGALVSAVVLALTLVERDRDRLRGEIALARARADAARLEAEMDSAREIQLSLLPADSARVGDLEIACAMTAARQVGGDFFDHFESHGPDGRAFLCLTLGDVSGKGLPASLFMALSKSLWKSAFLRQPQAPGAATGEANAAIAADNREAMFVTGLALAIAPETGEIVYAGAGHDMPLVLASDGRARSLDECSGPPLGLMAPLDFGEGQATLGRGEALALFTDGATEAMDADGRLYGLARLTKALEKTSGGDAAAIREGILSDIRRFTAGAEQSDDLTLVVVRRG